MWFSDESLKKNKNYYEEQISHNTDENLELFLFYGKEIFDNLFQRLDIWEELVSHLGRNKEERSKNILQVSDFDTSKEIQEALIKIKQKYPKLIENLLSDKYEFVELRKELFPTGHNLRGLKSE